MPTFGGSPSKYSNSKPSRLPRWRGSGRNWTALPDTSNHEDSNAALSSHSMHDSIARAGTVGIAAGPGKCRHVTRKRKNQRTAKAPQPGTAQPFMDLPRLCLSQGMGLGTAGKADGGLRMPQHPATTPDKRLPCLCRLSTFQLPKWSASCQVCGVLARSSR